MEKAKITIYLKSELVEQLDEKCKATGMTRNGYITNLLNSQLSFEKQIMDKLTPEMISNIIKNQL